jgi:glycosyltransferase involved in cell wall biosynthesis
MRIAFLTPEFPSEYSGGKGLGTYVYRMTLALIESGHEPEVFICSEQPSETLSYDGICVHRVGWRERLPFRRLVSTAGTSPPADAALVAIDKKNDMQFFRPAVRLMFQAAALASALEHRQREAPFALVQSANYLATGLFVRRRQGRVHAVRCSSAADLYNEIDGNTSNIERLHGYLERLAIRRADVAYAPSVYLAQYFARRHGINVKVIRPPKFSELQDPAQVPSIALPPRFLFHFGQLMRRKGTDLIAEALPLAWAAEPALTMVWSGQCSDSRSLHYWRSLWGARAAQVHMTGPLSKSDLYAVLRRAEAAVLPSQVDNLPNTVIESLMYGIPVVGSRGASIDELVQEGQTGHLVDIGDAKGLAEALVRIWRGESPVAKGFEWNAAIAEEMQPKHAVENLLSLVPPSEGWALKGR